MATSPLGGFADLSAYSPNAVAARAALAQQNSPLNAILQGAQQGYQISQIPAQIQQAQQDALNNQLLQALKAAQIRNALNQQGVFAPTAATATTPAALPAIPLTYEEQRAMAPYLPGTPEAIASQAPVQVPSALAPQDIRTPIQLGNGFVQAPEIQQQNLNEAIRRAAAQKQQEALMKPISINPKNSLIIPRGASGQMETLYTPPASEASPSELNDNQFKQLNVIQDNMRQDPDIKNYTQIKGEQQRMDAALRVGEQTNNYFGVDLALADQFIRGVNGNYAIRQGTQKILLSEQPLVNRLLGNMRALVMGQGGQGFTTADREQLLKLSKAFRDTSFEDYKDALDPYLQQADAVKIPHKFLPGAGLLENKVSSPNTPESQIIPKIYNSPQDIEAAGQRGEIKPGEVIFDKSVGKKATWNP